MSIELLLAAGRALEAGRLDHAERTYRQVVAADPRSSIAVAGLARVAARRGDGDQAVKLAAAALAIDPGNVAARRLLDEHNARQQVEPANGDERSPANGGERVPGEGERGAGERGAGDPGDERVPGDDGWPWPDLDQQLARDRQPGPGQGLLARLLKRGRG